MACDEMWVRSGPLASWMFVFVFAFEDEDEDEDEGRGRNANLRTLEQPRGQLGFSEAAPELEPSCNPPHGFRAFRD